MKQEVENRESKPIIIVSDYDYKQIRRAYAYVAAWKKLDPKRIKRILKEDVILYTSDDSSITGVENVIKYHNMWFDRIKTCIKNNPYAHFNDFSSPEKIEYFSVHVTVDSFSYEPILGYHIVFRENKIAYILLTYNDFPKILKKYGNKDVEVSINHKL